MRKPRIGKKSMRGGIGVAIVTAVFAAIGVVCLVIGYKDTVLSWLKTTGIVVLVVSAIPLCVLAYNLIQKKIDS